MRSFYIIHQQYVQEKIKNKTLAITSFHHIPTSYKGHPK